MRASLPPLLLNAGVAWKARRDAAPRFANLPFELDKSLKPIGPAFAVATTRREQCSVAEQLVRRRHCAKPPECRCCQDAIFLVAAVGAVLRFLRIVTLDLAWYRLLAAAVRRHRIAVVHFSIPVPRLPVDAAGGSAFSSAMFKGRSVLSTAPKQTI